MDNIYSEIKKREDLFNDLREDILSRYYTPEELLVNGRKDLIDIFVNTKTDIYLRGYACELFYEIVCIYMKDVFEKEGKKSAYITDIIIPSKAGGSQLDILFVTQSSIFCIECKSIFGNMDVKDSLISTNDGDINYKPWKQNSSHIWSIKSILEMNSEYIHNVVALFSIGQLNDIKLNNHEFLMTPTTATKLLYHWDSNSKYNRYNPEKIVSYLKRFKPSIEDKVNHIKRLETIFNRVS